MMLSRSGLEPSLMVMANGQAVPASDMPDLAPLGSSGVVGLTPAQIRKAYGIDQITFGGITGDGAGQTIAIVNAFDHPGFVSSDHPDYLTSDLHKFNVAMGLPDPPSFKKLDQRGGTATPTNVESNWAMEIALDVEWAHAIAPKANIVLIEADTDSYADMIGQALETARNLPNVSVISMSFGSVEFETERAYDSTFAIPTGHNGITYIGASGDWGTPGLFPSTANGVISVGGTSLSLNASNSWAGETAWSGSGGGVSGYVPKPSYQSGVGQSQFMRTIPDVAFNADPLTGVAVYDSYNGGTDTPWIQLGGTSFGSPAWAGLIAIANQGRALQGLNPLNGVSQLLPALYQLPASHYHDVTSGSNGLPAGAGYDLVTGRGSPIANTLIPALVNATSTTGGHLAGTLYIDSNYSGNIDSGNALISGNTVYIDADSDGAYDAGEVSTLSDQWGNFAFNNLPAGNYTIRSIAQGYVPRGITSHSVTLTTGQTRAGLNFGYVLPGSGTINVYIFNDSNGNGIQDGGEGMLGSRQVYLDTNENGRRDRNERVFTANASGVVSITNLGHQVHTVRPIVPAGSIATNRTFTFTTSPAAPTVSTGIGLSTLSTLHGSVYLDNDGSGSYTPGDSYSAIGTIWADLDNNGIIDFGEPKVAGAPTFTLGGLPEGTYAIRIQAPGYTQTEPPGSGWAYSVNSGAFDLPYDFRFGLYPGSLGYGAITGKLFEDLNDDMTLDAGENGLSDTTVFLDSNQNNQLDPSEQTAVTDFNGNYSFTGLLPGNYAVGALIPFAWHQTTPLSGPKVINVASNQTATANIGAAVNPGGNAYASGIVFYDTNGDGRRTGDSGQSGMQVYLDLNNNAVRDASEAVYITDSSGRFVIQNFPANVTYIVRMFVPGGSTTSTPDNYSVALTDGGSRTDLDFGLSPQAVIQGTLYNDSIVNGKQDDGETPASGQKVYLDLNSNGVFDSASEPSMMTGISGIFGFRVSTIRSYDVRVVTTPGLRLTGSGVQTVNVTGVNRFVTQPIGLTGTSRISGRVYDDMNFNWQDDSEPGLGGRTVFVDRNANGSFDNGERFDITDASGAYSIEGLANSQTYPVLLLRQPGTFQTTPYFSTTLGIADVQTHSLGTSDKPLVASAGGPYSVNEGSSITLSSIGTRQNDPSSPIISYQWDFNYVGGVFTVDATGSAPTFVAGDGQVTRQVALRVFNSNGISSLAVTNLTINNVAPTATFGNGGAVTTGSPATASFTGAADPSSADISAGLKYSFDFNNDGDFSDTGDVFNSSSATAAFTYAAAGTFRVRGRISDKDGAFSEYTTDILVNPATSGGGSTVTLVTGDDTYVRDGSYANTSFGGETQLIIKKDGTGSNRESWIKFDIASLSGITSAKVRVFAKLSNSASPITMAAYGSTGTGAWNEGALTWNNKPAGTTGELGRATVSSTAGTWFEFDVTSYLQAQKAAGRATAAIVMQALNGTTALIQMNSRQSASNKPELVVTQGSTPQAIVLSTGAISVTEGSTANFSVKLASAPTSDVTVNIVRQAGGDADLNASISTLVFTPANWDTAQSVTISGANDADSTNGVATFTLSSSGLSDQAVTVSENDTTTTPTPTTGDVTLTSAADTYIRDGGSANTNFGGDTQLIIKKDGTGSNRESWIKFDIASLGSITSAKLRLFGRLSNSASPIVVAAYGSTGDGSWAENALTWNNRPAGTTGELGRVSVSSATASGFEIDVTSYLLAQKSAGKTTAVLVLRALNGTTALVQFNSRQSASNKPQLVVSGGSTTTPPQSLVVTPSTLNVAEGATQSFAVKLGSAPTSDVTVTIGRTGDSDLSTSTSTLVFTAANWNVDQNVTVAAAQDADTANGSATFTISATGITSESVVATEIDDDVPTGGSATLNALADAYVRDGSSGNTNFGGVTQLQVKKDGIGNSRESYVSFDLTSIGSLTQAKLRLFGKLNDTYATGLIAGIYGADNASWGESTITYNNRPAATATLEQQTILGTVGKWYEFDVTSFLQQQKALGRTVATFIIRAITSGPTMITFNSGEAANGPQLTVS